ncbi:MAG TPA: aspartyl protease family protein [Candidatus Lustribacter sp.]
MDAPPPVATILAAYDRATHGVDVETVETSGTLNGDGLTGAFHSWRAGDRERDDEGLGPRLETTLRLGDRIWVRNSNGNVHELTGVLRRRALTAEFVNSGAFLRAPCRARFVGFGTIGDRRTWNVEVNAAGGEPETLWIDARNGLPLRTEYLDGDGPTYIDLSDWREVGGMKIAFRSVTTDGEHEFDTVQQTAWVKLGRPIDSRVFAPLVGRTLVADGVQTVPLLDDGSRIACRVVIAGKTYAFLIDSGSGNVVLDTRVASDAGLGEQGALEVRGAVRSGGMHVAHLSRLTIGAAALDDLVVSTIDLRSASGRTRIDGILGYPFFASSLVQLDFAHRVMRFGPPGSFAPAGDRIALDTDREIPEAVFRINGTVDAPFIVDTGNSGEVLLYAPFVADHPRVAPAVGAGANSYVGVGGADRTYSTRLDTFALGSTVLSGQAADVIVAKNGAFADRIDAGNVGLGVLRKFVVTFDFADHAMYLQRSAGV